MTDKTYYAIIEDGNLLLIQLTPEMEAEIHEKHFGDEEDYLYAVLSEKYNISINNCQWGIVSESCMTCYGRLPQINH